MRAPSHINALSAAGPHGTMRISSLDVPMVALGKPTPFVTPRDEVPDMSGGIHYNPHNNIWNTNYVLWYPFNEEDANSQFRFTIDIS